MTTRAIKRTTPERPYVNLITAPKWCARALKQAAEHQPAAEGWSNTATHIFSLYFLQERENHETLCGIIRHWRQPGKPLPDVAYTSAKYAMEIAYHRERMAPMDGDEEGSVNVREIVDTLAAELKWDLSTVKPPKKRKA